jgi:hypothetical protein
LRGALQGQRREVELSNRVCIQCRSLDIVYFFFQGARGSPCYPSFPLFSFSLPLWLVPTPKFRLHLYFSCFSAPAIFDSVVTIFRATTCFTREAPDP